MIACYYRFVVKIADGIKVRINSFLVKKLVPHQKKEVRDVLVLNEVYNNSILQTGQCIISGTSNKIETNHIIPANYKNPFIHFKFLQVLHTVMFPLKKTKGQLTEAYIWGNGWSNGYYHFVAEDLPKLFFMQTQGVPIYSWSKHTSRWREELFGLFSIQSILIEQPIFANKIYYIANNRIRKPEFKFSILHPTLSAIVINNINQLAEKWGLKETTQKKIIWISRKYTFDRNIVNEDDCINLLQKKGIALHVLYPEKSSVKEQIQLVYSASWIIGPHGAGLTNLVFTNNAGLIEIGPSEIINNSFTSLAASFNRQYNYLKVKPTNKLLKHRSNFLIESVAAFADEIEKITLRNNNNTALVK